MNELSDFQHATSPKSHWSTTASETPSSAQNQSRTPLQSLSNVNVGRKRLSMGSAPKNMKRKKGSTALVSEAFHLPVFSPDLQRCIKNDAFYTTTQRNKLIKEACTALRGYYWEKEQPVSNDSKRMLAKTLVDLAPKSLGDSCVRGGKATGPEVSYILQSV